MQKSVVRVVASVLMLSGAIMMAPFVAPAAGGKMSGTATAAETEKPKTAGFEIIGMNGRGLFFGLESFGLRGDGRPYAEIRIYDLRKDGEIDRSPFIYEMPGKPPEGMAPEQAVDLARRRVYREASRVIRFLTLVPRGSIIFADGDKPVRALRISTPAYSGMLTLETFPLSSDRCAGVKTVGFRLKATGVLGSTLIHEDKSLAKDRGCPTEYGIEAANVYQPYGDSVVLAVVIGARQGDEKKGASMRHTVVGHVYIRDKDGWH